MESLQVPRPLLSRPSHPSPSFSPFSSPVLALGDARNPTPFVTITTICQKAEPVLPCLTLLRAPYLHPSFPPSRILPLVHVDLSTSHPSSYPALEPLIIQTPLPFGTSPFAHLFPSATLFLSGAEAVRGCVQITNLVGDSHHGQPKVHHGPGGRPAHPWDYKGPGILRHALDLPCSRLFGTSRSCPHLRSRPQQLQQHYRRLSQQH